MYPGPSQTVTAGGSVLFQCRVMAGIPTPEVTWARVDGAPMAANVESMPGGALRIQRITGSEAGRYR